ncbi:hypothetical protein SK128_009686, partial [Halocaridina rubra]
VLRWDRTPANMARLFPTRALHHRSIATPNRHIISISAMSLTKQETYYQERLALLNHSVQADFTVTKADTP